MRSNDNNNLMNTQSSVNNKFFHGNWWRRILLSLLVGYVFYFFSEIGFWSNPASLKDFGGTWLVYSYAAYLFYWGLDYFQVKNKYGVFLLGCLYGWLIEGVIVYTVYEMLPFSISWTAMAWHGLVTVLAGFYGFEVFARRSTKTVFMWSMLAGLFYGSWATFWWVTTPDERFVLTPIDYGLFIFLINMGLVIALFGIELVKTKEFKPTRNEVILVSLVFLFFFIIGNIILLGLPLLVLIPLTGITWIPLKIEQQKMKKIKQQEKEKEKEKERQEKKVLSWFYEEAIPRGRLLIIFFLPATATIYYSIAYKLELRLEMNVIVFLITVPTSIAFYIISWIKIIKTT